MQMLEKFSIALLAGGKSTRMGRDKGLVPFMGKPLFQYILDQVAGVSGDTFLITNLPESYVGIPNRIFVDKIPDIGALGGIYSALSYSKNELCLILACDMPFIHKGLIDRLLVDVQGYDVAIPELSSEMLEPFRAIYRKSCLQPIETAIQSGERRAVSFLSEVRTNRIPKSTIILLEPELESFLNINTPNDLVEIEQIAERLKGNKVVT